MHFRTATHEDLPLIKQLYVETIHNVCNKEYNEQQLKVWSATTQNTQRWQDTMDNQYVILAEKEGRLAGFATLKLGNYIDFFYVGKDFQRQGVARDLLNKIEQQANLLKATYLSADISLSAKGFFERNGFEVIQQQENYRDGVVLINFNMKKIL